MPKASEVKKNAAIEHNSKVYLVKDINKLTPSGRAGASLYRMRLYEVATGVKADESFKADVLESDKPVLVDFWAEWCGPCKMIAPALEEISEELGESVTIAKMDIMENTGIPADMGVQSIPLMVLFKNGEPVARKVGAAPKSQLKEWIEGEI